MNDYIRGLLAEGPATDCLDGIEREIARDAYALGQADARAGQEDAPFDDQRTAGAAALDREQPS